MLPMFYKDHFIKVRVTAAEKAAVLHFAAVNGQSVSDMFRARVLRAAINYDPRQSYLNLQKPHAPPLRP